MKGEAVSAFPECGLDLAGRDAEPQVSESNNSMERKTDTMKTYILRDLKTVEPQRTARPSRSKPTPAPGGHPSSVAGLLRGTDETSRLQSRRCGTVRKHPPGSESRCCLSGFAAAHGSAVHSRYSHTPFVICQ